MLHQTAESAATGGNGCASPSARLFLFPILKRNLKQSRQSELRCCNCSFLFVLTGCPRRPCLLKKTHGNPSGHTTADLYLCCPIEHDKKKNGVSNQGSPANTSQIFIFKGSEKFSRLFQCLDHCELKFGTQTAFLLLLDKS